MYAIFAYTNLYLFTLFDLKVKVIVRRKCIKIIQPICRLQATAFHLG